MQSVTPELRETNFPFLNYRNIQENFDAVIDYVNGHNFSKSLDGNNKKRYFISALNQLQNSYLDKTEKEIVIDFDSPKHAQSMIENQLFTLEDIENEKHLFNREEQIAIKDKIEKALSILKVLHFDLYDLINQHISTIYVVKKKGYGGGSVSGLLGFIWLNPQPQWSILDFAENLYHEFIHNSLFLDDMVNCIFPDPLACAEEDGLVISTILKVNRPLDKSYHAANVSIGIMHFYYLLGKIPEDRNYFTDLTNTLNGINEKTHLLGEQGLRNLEEMNNFLKIKDFDSITLSLRKS